MQTETEFTPSDYVVPGRLVVGYGINGNAEVPELEIASTTSIYKLAAWLQTLDPVYYTDARLASMSKNDMRYAHRVLDDIDLVVPDIGL